MLEKLTNAREAFITALNEKPENEQKIKEIVSVMGYLYHTIGKIILSGGLLLACFFPLIFPDAELGLPIIYLTFFSFLGSSLIGYFINYKQVLLSADHGLNPSPARLKSADPVYYLSSV